MLKAAHNSLSIECVNLKESRVIVRDAIELSDIDQGETTTQRFRAVNEIMEGSSSDDGDQNWYYRFAYSVGTRMIFSVENEISANEDFVPLCEIVAVFVAKYASNKQLASEDLEAFAESNVGYHVWPYWREYAQSTCARINLNPAITIPFYFVPKTSTEEQLV